MRYTMTIVEQLDRAARELSTDHPINNRLALILVDNATELVLHRRCSDHLSWEKVLRKLSPRQRAMARGAFLEGKLKVLEDLGDLSASERQFIKIAHDYRNELYHIGLKHDDITRAIAGEYYKLACAIFVRLKPNSRVSSSTDTFTEVADRYLPKRNGRHDFLGVDNDQLAEKLMAARPQQMPPVQTALAASARKAVDEVEEAFDFLARDNPAKLDEAEVLQNVQWHFDFTRALEREGVEGSWMDPGYLEGAANVKSALRATWRQRHTSVPLEKWRARADAIEREPDPLIATAEYQALRNDMAYLEEAIMVSAGELDAWIQLEIDRARGK